MKRPVVINIFGGPGAGKSTTAASVFAALKKDGVSCELITEFAKDLTWEKEDSALTAQAYVFGNQYYRMYRCADQVDVLVTDSPLLLCIIHNTDRRCEKHLPALILEAFDSFDNRNYFLEQPKLYDETGRKESAAEAEQLSGRLRALLEDHRYNFLTVPFDETRDSTILRDVREYLTGRGAGR